MRIDMLEDFLIMSLFENLACVKDFARVNESYDEG